MTLLKKQLCYQGGAPAAAQIIRAVDDVGAKFWVPHFDEEIPWYYAYSVDLYSVYLAATCILVMVFRFFWNELCAGRQQRMISLTEEQLRDILSLSMQRNSSLAPSKPTTVKATRASQPKGTGGLRPRRKR